MTTKRLNNNNYSSNTTLILMFYNIYIYSLNLIKSQPRVIICKLFGMSQCLSEALILLVFYGNVKTSRFYH